MVNSIVTKSILLHNYHVVTRNCIATAYLRNPKDPKEAQTCAVCLLLNLIRVSNILMFNHLRNSSYLSGKKTLVNSLCSQTIYNVNSKQISEGGKQVVKTCDPCKEILMLTNNLPSVCLSMT